MLNRVITISREFGSGVRFASAEGVILDNNIIFADDNPLIDNWGTEYRFGRLGSVYTWKNTVLTNNIFYCENKWKPEFIFDLPPHASFYDMYADGNRFYIKNGFRSTELTGRWTKDVVLRRSYL